MIAVTLITEPLQRLPRAWCRSARCGSRRQIRQHHRLTGQAGTAMVQFPRMSKRTRGGPGRPVASRGMRLRRRRLDFDDVKERERVLVEASGADGLVSYFEGEVRRSAQPARTAGFADRRCSYLQAARVVRRDRALRLRRQPPLARGVGPALSAASRSWTSSGQLWRMMGYARRVGCAARSWRKAAWSLRERAAGDGHARRAVAVRGGRGGAGLRRRRP